MGDAVWVGLPVSVGGGDQSCSAIEVGEAGGVTVGVGHGVQVGVGVALGNGVVLAVGDGVDEGVAVGVLVGGGVSVGDGEGVSVAGGAHTWSKPIPWSALAALDSPLPQIQASTIPGRTRLLLAPSCE